MPKRPGTHTERNHVVYQHLRPADRSRMYIGLGTGRRPWRFRSRNADWDLEHLLHGDPIVEIVASKLTIEEAGDLERQLIAEARAAGENIVNIAIGGGSTTAGLPIKPEVRRLQSRMNRERMSDPTTIGRLSGEKALQDAEKWLQNDSVIDAILGLDFASVPDLKIERVHAFVADKESLRRSVFAEKVAALSEDPELFGLQQNTDGSLCWRRYFLGKAIRVRFGAADVMPQARIHEHVRELNRAVPDFALVDVIKERIEAERDLLSGHTARQAAKAQKEQRRRRQCFPENDPDFGFGKDTRGQMYWRRKIGRKKVVCPLGKTTFVPEKTARLWAQDLSSVGPDRAAVNVKYEGIKAQIIQLGGNRSKDDPEAGFSILACENKMRWKRIVNHKRKLVHLGSLNKFSEAQGRQWARELNAAMGDPAALQEKIHEVRCAVAA